MSDEPFQRPGSHPGGTDVRLRTSSVWDQPDDDAPPLLELGDPQAPPEEPPRRGRVDVALAAAAGIALGVAGTGFALNAGNGTGDPLEITPDTFPREVMNLLRDDLLPRDLQDAEAITRLDEHFAQQVESYRFAYGGEGASMYYSVGGSGVEYTIVNGILPPSLPSSGPGDGTLAPVLVSHESDLVVCTVQRGGITVDAETGLPVETDLDSVTGWTSCILTDGPRNLSLRLTEVGVQRNNAVASAEQLSTELERLHDDLTS
ncbi:hypothetical protein GCM10028820_06090 [Tessaracoccus terricola]